MDPNIQTILLGLLTNGLTSFIAQFGRKDSKLLLGEKILKKMKWEETALQPTLQRAAHDVAENIEWQGTPSLEVVCLFLTSPEAEAIVRQIYATQLSKDESNKNFVSLRKEFLTSFWLYTTSYSSYVNLKENQLTKASNILFDALLASCEQAFNAAIDEGKLSAHEAKSAFRHRLLLEELTAIRENVTFLTSEKKPNVKDILAFEETYRRLIGNRHKYITPPNFGRVRQIHINKLYISPNLVTSSKHSDEKQQLLLYPESQESSSIPYRKVLTRTFRAVVLGNPGAGKSTLAQKLCYELVTHYDERIFGGRRYLTPIIVTLRDYGPAKKNQSCSILEFIQAKTKADHQLQPPLGAFEYLFLNGRALVIFDGLDELLDTRDRQEISKAVEAFCTLYPSVPVLVTSREVGYEQAPLDEEVFEIFRLAPFSEHQMREYVRKWFDVITDVPSEQRKQKAESFLQESQMVPDLRTNPLMLALLCNIYREENYIPTNRPDVYEKCANMLFERWDRSRGININLPFDIHLRPTMAHLAYWIYASEGLRGGVTEEQLIAKTTEYLREKLLEDEAHNVAREFIEFCKGRAWVFTNTGSTKQGEELYQFTHQTFLEYFTAAYLCRMHSTPTKLLNILRSKILKREWDVVAQLAFQIQNRNLEGAGDKLLSILIKQTYVVSDKEKWNLLSFIVRCLEFMVPSAYVIQDITRACIKHALSWGIERSKNKSSQVMRPHQEDFRPEEVIGFLLSAAADNRRPIALNLEDILTQQAKSASESEAILALEIGLNLVTFLDHILGDDDSETRITKFHEEALAFWQSVSDRILESCSHQITTLCQKYFPLCTKLFMKRKVNVSDIIKWHGEESIFHEYHYLMIPAATFISIASWLTCDLLSPGNGIAINSSIQLDALREISSLLLSSPSPWLKTSSPDLNLDMFPFSLLLFYKQKDKKNEKVLDFDSEVLFGILILLATLAEANQEVGAKNTHWTVKSVQTNNVIKVIKASTHPILQYFHWILIARYESLQLELGDTPSIFDKVQTEMESCKFTVGQQNFVWRWIRREINLTQRISPN